MATGTAHLLLLMCAQCGCRRWNIWGHVLIAQNREGRETVSYTHLDVYKRQAVSYVFYRSLPVFILLSPFGLCYPLIKKRDLKEQRLKKLNLEFKEGILILSSFLSAGYSVENAFSASVKELVVMYGPSGMMTLEDVYKRQAVNPSRSSVSRHSAARRSGTSPAPPFHPTRGTGRNPAP